MWVNRRWLSPDEIVKELDSIRESVMLFFAPKTLDLFKKSGRVSVATAIIGNILNLVPGIFISWWRSTFRRKG